MALKALRQIVEEVPACLFEAVNAGQKAEHAVVAALETAGLVDVDLFLGGRVEWTKAAVMSH